MIDKPRIWPGALLGAALICGAAAQAQALDLTIGGAFHDPNDVLLIEFSVAGPGPFARFTAFTSNFDSANSLADPIDPLLTLFVGTGDSAFLGAEDDDGAWGFSAAIDGMTFTGELFDSLLTFNLPVGEYTLGLSSFANFAEGPLLGDGYSDFGFDTGNFRLHLLGVDEILSTQGPPVSPSFPRRDPIS